MKQGNDKGFTLVELIVVIVIVAILAAISVPAFLSYLDDSKEKACGANREALTLEWKSEKIFNPEVTLEEFLNSDNEAIQRITCPSGGVYSVAKAGGIDVISCSKHKSDYE